MKRILANVAWVSVAPGHWMTEDGLYAIRRGLGDWSMEFKAAGIHNEWRSLCASDPIRFGGSLSKLAALLPQARASRRASFRQEHRELTIAIGSVTAKYTEEERASFCEELELLQKTFLAEFGETIDHLMKVHKDTAP
jgi:hypothetical protein